MIQVACTACGEELGDLGALVFSPPISPMHTVVEKFHLCVDCWDIVGGFIHKMRERSYVQDGG